MVKPCKGATRKQLLELFGQRVFYHVHHGHKGVGDANLKPCILSRVCEWDADHPAVVYFDDNMSLQNYSAYARWEDLYDGWEEASKEIKHINKLYTKGFWRSPYVTIETLEKFKGEMVRIEKLINKGLEDYPNFLGIDFCDVNANGIQIRGHHKAITTHTYGNQPTIKYDFTNKNEVIDEFIEMWIQLDTPDEVKRYKGFIDFGNKYGWD